MSNTYKVGLTRDFFGADGRTPIFDPAAFAILDAEPRIAWDVLPELTPEITPDQAAAYDAVMILSPKVPASAVARSDRRLLHVSRYGVGFEIIDTAACTDADVVVTITPEGVRRPVAAMALTFILALAHRLLIKDRLVRTDRWGERTKYMGIGLEGRTLGCIGVGNTAVELFRLVAPFGMKLVGHDPFVPQSAVDSLGVRMTGLDELLAESDFVSLHVPLNPKTRELIGARELGLMKRSAYLVNTARGPIIDEPALVAALREGRIAGAGLDVFAVEPIAPDNPLIGLDNVILSPHALCWTDECWRLCAETAFRNIVAVSRGEVPGPVVNRDVLGRDSFIARLGANRQ